MKAKRAGWPGHSSKKPGGESLINAVSGAGSVSATSMTSADSKTHSIYTINHPLATPCACLIADLCLL